MSYDRTQRRDFKAHSYHSAMGRSSCKIDCPFCATRFIAFLWSLAGGGKKCPKCGALHTSLGTAYPVAAK